MSNKIIYNNKGIVLIYTIKKTLRKDKEEYGILMNETPCDDKGKVKIMSLDGKKNSSISYDVLKESITIENDTLPEAIKPFIISILNTIEKRMRSKLDFNNTDKNKKQKLDIIKNIVTKSKDDNKLKIGDNSFEIPLNEKGRNVLLNSLYEIRQELLIKEMYDMDENVYNTPLKIDEYDEMTKDNINKINKELINCSLKEIRPVFSLYYNNFINLVNNATEERVKIIKDYIALFYKNDKLFTQFKKIIDGDGEETEFKKKIKGEKFDSITLEDLEGHEKLRYIRAKKPTKKGGRTRKKEGNKRNKTLKKVK